MYVILPQEGVDLKYLAERFADEGLVYCNGVMGVPITFLDRYCPEQFEILGITKSWFGMASKVYGPQVQVSRDGGRKQVMKLNDQPALVRRPTDVGTYYECDGRQYVALYQRILIRRKV